MGWFREFSTKIADAFQKTEARRNMDEINRREINQGLGIDPELTNRHEELEERVKELRENKELTEDTELKYIQVEGRSGKEKGITAVVGNETGEHNREIKIPEMSGEAKG